MTSESPPRRESPDDLHVFKLHVLHPTEAPHMYWTIWKHPGRLGEKVGAHLVDVLGVDAQHGRNLAERLLAGETLVYPFGTRLHDACGVVLVPGARAHVVTHEDAGRA